MVKLHQGLPRLTTAISVSLLILLTATHARPVDEVADDTIRQWNATEPHRLEQRWIQCDWAHIATIVTQPLQDSDDHCTLAAKKGHRLVCMMVNPTTQRSVYQEARELAFYGYVSQVAGNDIQPGLSNINEALRGAGLTDEPTQWFYINQFHVRDSGDFPSTNAFFQNHASPVQGAIIAFNNKNPEMMNHDSLDRTLDADQVVPLKQWSDVFFLGWKEACRTSRGGVANMRRLEHVFRDNVINQGTIEVLRSIVGKDYLGVRDMVSLFFLCVWLPSHTLIDYTFLSFLFFPFLSHVTIQYITTDSYIFPPLSTVARFPILLRRRQNASCTGHSKWEWPCLAGGTASGGNREEDCGSSAYFQLWVAVWGCVVFVFSFEGFLSFAISF